MLNSNSIGNKIAEARKKINLSQAELAQQVSISPQAVGKWERGESMPDSLLSREEPPLQVGRLLKLVFLSMLPAVGAALIAYGAMLPDVHSEIVKISWPGVDVSTVQPGGVVTEPLT